MRNGASGGRDAAKNFLGTLLNLLRARGECSPHLKLVIRLYASVCKLGEAYLRTSIVENIGTWNSFVQGFNRELPLCEIIDAGTDKESADLRIKGKSC